MHRLFSLKMIPLQRWLWTPVTHPNAQVIRIQFIATEVKRKWREGKYHQLYAMIMIKIPLQSVLHDPSFEKCSTAERENGIERCEHKRWKGIEETHTNKQTCTYRMKCQSVSAL